VKKHKLHEALERARAVLHFARRRESDLRLAGLLKEITAGRKYPERLLIRSTGKIALVLVEDIDWLESDGDYVRIHARGKKHLLRTRIGDLERQLDPARFIRIHRSSMVALHRIAAMTPATNGDYVIILNDGSQLNLSRTYRENVFSRLQ
jgi:two-component system LytT family response regulator